jgi:hypothetical protein
MYALGDPYTVKDFYLVGLNPRLPRCPFCYRAPTRRERIRVHSGGRTFDVTPGLVRVTGSFRVTPRGDDPYHLDLEHLEVVLPNPDKAPEGTANYAAGTKIRLVP